MSKKKMESMQRLTRKSVFRAFSGAFRKETSNGVTIAVKSSARDVVISQGRMKWELRGSIR